MKHIGNTLKKFIEENHLVKKEVAKAAGITHNYLSTIFRTESIDAALLEKLCVATGLSPMSFFDFPGDAQANSVKDIHQSAMLGTNSLQIQQGGSDIELYKQLLEEKERMIQVLMASSGISTGAKPEQR